MAISQSQVMKWHKTYLSCLGNDASAATGMSTTAHTYIAAWTWCRNSNFPHRETVSCSVWKLNSHLGVYECWILWHSGLFRVGAIHGAFLIGGRSNFASVLIWLRLNDSVSLFSLYQSLEALDYLKVIIWGEKKRGWRGNVGDLSKLLLKHPGTFLLPFIDINMMVWSYATHCSYFYYLFRSYSAVHCTLSCILIWMSLSSLFHHFCIQFGFNISTGQ